MAMGETADGFWIIKQTLPPIASYYNASDCPRPTCFDVITAKRVDIVNRNLQNTTVAEQTTIHILTHIYMSTHHKSNLFALNFIYMILKRLCGLPHIPSEFA